eukprot:CAMPEP_0114134430 /NCGR_PEP_ID=MMETSP0043_2-20121206/14152_1 /TAXON_ID=464988 /ORGANISM="Hemiselmis andersenii, Strain CCMP644" /LENGTH=142 /DNA_ID=CAMNT_0001228067 /DNA_START=72 /DNA_END=496 /DNA_ORIENTATION=+
MEREGAMDIQNLRVGEEFERGTDYRPPMATNLQGEVRAQRAAMERDPFFDSINLECSTPIARPEETPIVVRNFLATQKNRPKPKRRVSMDIGTSEDHDYGHLSDEEWSGQRLHTPSQSKGGAAADEAGEGQEHAPLLWLTVE